MALRGVHTPANLFDSGLRNQNDCMELSSVKWIEKCVRLGFEADSSTKSIPIL